MSQNLCFFYDVRVVVYNEDVDGVQRNPLALSQEEPQSEKCGFKYLP